MNINKSVEYYEFYIFDLISVHYHTLNKDEICVRDFTCSLFQGTEDNRAKGRKFSESKYQLASNMEFYESVCTFMETNTPIRVVEFIDKIRPCLKEMTEKLKDYTAK